MLATFVDAAMSQYRTQVSPSSPGYPGFGQSGMLSVAVANGLAAIGLEFTQNVTACSGGWCSQGPYYTRGTGYTIFNGTGEEGITACEYDSRRQLYPAKSPTDSSLILQSFKEPSKSFRDSQWTQVSFPVFKYGYGWSFTPVTIKIATAVLMLHALFIIAHVSYIILSAQSYTFARDLAELLALALESRPSEVFSAASVKHSKSSEVWKRSVAVRQTQASKYDAHKLELVVCSGFEKGGAPEREVVVEDDYL